MSQAAPRTAPAWKLFRTVLNANSGSNSAAWRYLLEKLEPIKQKEAKIEQALREQFAYERSDHGLIRITHDSDGISTADVKPEQYGYLLYGKKQKKLDALFDKLGAEWVNRTVQELQARCPAEAAEMKLAELVQAAPTAGGATPADADQAPDQAEASKTKRRTQRRKRTGAAKDPTLTPKQTEAMKLHGDCEGNVAEIGRRLGIGRKAAEDRVKAAFKKLGRSIPRKASTKALPAGRRGEEIVSKSDDKRE